MKAMIWKEWRENLRWALLAIVALGLAAAYSLWQFHKVLFNGGDYTNATLLPWLTIAAPLVALVLGFLQIVPEQRRDHWAFLLHRPVTRDVIFAGKAVAGLSLYFPATLLPAAVAVVWLATPGHVPAPFDIRMTLPGIADILAGIPFYFAAMLTVLRPARWYGSRALPILTAFFGLLPAFFLAEEFIHAAVISLIFAVLLGTAVWGSFRTSGQYAGQPKVAQTALGMVLYVSLVVIIVSAVVLAMSFKGSDDTSLNQSSDQPIIYYRVTLSGRIVRIKQVDGEAVSATDLEGHTVPVSSNGVHDPDGNGTWFGLGESSSDQPGTYRFLGRYHSWLRVDGDPQNLVWYYSFRQRRILGYSTRSNRLAWVGGSSGIVSAAQPLPPKFPIGLHNSSNPINYDVRNNGLLVFDHVVYALNLADQRLAPIAVVATPEKVDQLATLYMTGNRSNGLPLLVVKTPNRVQIFDPFGKMLLSVPRYFGSTEHDEVENIYRLPHGDRFFFWYRDGEIVETDAQGRVLKRVILPPQASTETETETESNYLPFGYGSLVPPGLILGSGAYVVAWRHIPHTPAAEEAAELARHRRAYTIFFIVSGLVGVVGAVLAWLIGRRCGWNRVGQWIWTVSVFLLGVYGLLMLLALVPWPTRERCPNCGRKRVVTREHCEHCGAPFAPVIPDGTEIFDEVMERVSVA